EIDERVERAGALVDPSRAFGARDLVEEEERAAVRRNAGWTTPLRADLEQPRRHVERSAFAPSVRRKKTKRTIDRRGRAAAIERIVKGGVARSDDGIADRFATGSRRIDV